MFSQKSKKLLKRELPANAFSNADGDLPEIHHTTDKQKYVCLQVNGIK